MNLLPTILKALMLSLVLTAVPLEQLTLNAAQKEKISRKRKKKDADKEGSVKEKQLKKEEQKELSKQKEEAKETKIVLGDRPVAVQKAVDKAFKKCKKYKASGEYTWHYNGASDYKLLKFNDYSLLRNLALLNPEKKDVYVIDVGCGQGNWGFNAMNVLLKDKACQESGKQFHIFSVTGGNECKEEVIQKDNVTHYVFPQFKVENIVEAFSTRGFDLKGKVDLIVARWTLRHLADPFGTLKFLYSLLTPLQGKLLATGFKFAFDDSEQVCEFPYGNLWNLLDKSNAISLFMKDNRALNHFLLMRNSDQELAIPIEYTGKMRSLGDDPRVDCASGVVTLFKRGLFDKGGYFFFKAEGLHEEFGEFDVSSEDGPQGFHRTIYCNKDNQLSKDLYAQLKSQGLFL